MCFGKSKRERGLSKEWNAIGGIKRQNVSKIRKIERESIIGIVG